MKKLLHTVTRMLNSRDRNPGILPPEPRLWNPHRPSSPVGSLSWSPSTTWNTLPHMCCYFCHLLPFKCIILNYKHFLYFYYPYWDYFKGCLLSYSPLHPQEQVQFFAHMCSLKRSTKTHILGKEDLKKKFPVLSVDLINWCKACSMLYLTGDPRLTGASLLRSQVLL